MHIQGPSGPLEATLDQTPVESTAIAVLCHPHPQYGGSMHDAVLQAVTKSFLTLGVNCLRFNFRGVGLSAGSYDNGAGEVEDLRSVCQWVVDEYPQQDLWLAGYSFGSNIVWKSLPSIKPHMALLIAPPLGRMDFSDHAITTDIRAIAGDRDDFVDTTKFTEWLGERAHVLTGADHFFSGYHHNLTQLITSLYADRGDS